MFDSAIISVAVHAAAYFPNPVEVLAPPGQERGAE